MIKDSGNRTEFKSGAVRDIQEGKGRCDLLPLDIIDKWCDYGVQNTLYHVGEYLKRKGSEGSEDYFGLILDHFAAEHQTKRFTSGEDNEMISLDQYKWNLVLEVAKHFEEGAKKYGDRNWEKGIPCDRYIDSAVRHYCKWRAGWTDEPHDRAFIWNILCCEWTRLRYGWNLERLAKKESGSFTKKPYDASGTFVDVAKMSSEELYERAYNILTTSTPLHKWSDVPDYDFRTRCLNRYFYRPFGEQLAKGIRDGLELMSSLYGEEAAEKMRWACSQLTQTETALDQYKEALISHEYKGAHDCDFGELFKVLGIEESKEKEQEQEIANLKEACAIIEHEKACFETSPKDCWNKNCDECEHYIDPDITYRAINQLLDHTKQSLENTETK